MFDFFYGIESEQFSFYQIPKELFTNTYFSKMSTESKVLYGLLLDRMSLSRKNGWLDKNNRVYIIFTQSEAQEMLSCSKNKIIDYFAELDNIGLIMRKKQGLGKPAIIYIYNIFHPIDDMTSNDINDDNVTSTKYVEEQEIKKSQNEMSRTPEIGCQELPKQDVKNSQNRTSRTPEIGCQELPKQDPNNTNINNTNFSNTDINSSSSTPTLKLDDEDYIKSVIEIFKWHCPALFKNLDCNFLTTSQKSAIIDLSVHHNFVLDTFIKLCNEINSNEFLRGGGRNGWKPNLDWVLAPNNAINILQGKYYFQKLEGYKTVKPYENNGIVPNAFNNYTQKMYDNDELMAAVKRKEQKRRIEQSGGLKNENNKDYKVR